RNRRQIATLEKLVQNLERRLSEQAAQREGRTATAAKSPLPNKEPGSGSASGTVRASDNSAAIAADMALCTVPLRGFRNAGQSSPRAAMETLAWATGNGDTREIEKVLTMDQASRQKLEA